MTKWFDAIRDVPKSKIYKSQDCRGNVQFAGKEDAVMKKRILRAAGAAVTVAAAGSVMTATVFASGNMQPEISLTDMLLDLAPYVLIIAAGIAILILIRAWRAEREDLNAHGS